MITKRIDREVSLLAFISRQKAAKNAHWFLDKYFRTERTTAELVEIRDFCETEATPLKYVGACDPANVGKGRTETLTVREMAFPVIKEKRQIKGCDVDEQRILPDGTVLKVGKQRYDHSVKKAMKAVFEDLRATFAVEAIDLLRTGRYVITRTDNRELAVIDFKRDPRLTQDLTGTVDDWCTSKCADLNSWIEDTLQVMSELGVAVGEVHFHHSKESWRAFQAHSEAEAVKYRDSNLRLGGPKNGEKLDFSFKGVMPKGQSHQGQIKHFVNNTEYTDQAGVRQKAVRPGELLIVTDGFMGVKLHRTVTSDNKEKLPSGGPNFFLYDDPSDPTVYKKDCRSYEPWLEEYHLMLASNVNGAALIKVMDPDCKVCVECEDCPTP